MDAPAQPDVQATFCSTLVDESARAGMADAVVCPGSRSTPLAIALASDARISVHVRLDERSAGFFALGAALATGRVVAICTTSGTAAAELHAGVVEAHHAGVALVVCTADRPEQLQGVGAPQTIDQSGLFGTAVLWSANPGIARWAERATWRSLAARAIAEASQGPRGAGPVHLNLAFDEPLLGAPVALPPGRAGGEPWHRVVRQGPEGVRQTAPQPPGLELITGRRLLVVAGAGGGAPDSILGAARVLGAPVLADPLSGCRRNFPGVIAAGDAILRNDQAASLLRPHVVLRIGSVHASRALASRLHEWALAGTDQVLLDHRWGWADPDRDAGTVINEDVESWCESVVSHVGSASAETLTDRRWLESWIVSESTAQDAIAEWCDGHPEATEPGAARAVMRALPAGAVLVVASSMPVRDVEWFGGVRDDPPRVIANRGANGIDGVVSTAMGVAATRTGRGPVVALVGDLAFLHDLTALVGMQGDVQRKKPRITVVVVDNSGGGIFSFLPQRGGVPDDAFERLFGTPPSSDIGAAARGLGGTVKDVSTISGLEEALRASVGDPGTSVVRVEVPGRDENVELHEDINAQIGKKVVDALTGLT